MSGGREQVGACEPRRMSSALNYASDQSVWPRKSVGSDRQCLSRKSAQIVTRDVSMRSEVVRAVLEGWWLPYGTSVRGLTTVAFRQGTAPQLEWEKAMALSLVNNVASVSVQNNLSKTSASLTKSLDRLSSGLKINRGADGPAALFVASTGSPSAGTYNRSGTVGTTNGGSAGPGGLENTVAAESVIRDTDFAAEIANFTVNPRSRGAAQYRRRSPVRSVVVSQDERALVT